MNLLVNVLIPVVILWLLIYDIVKGTREDCVSSKEYCIALTGFTLLVFVFTYSTGILGSGYHFVDDHEIYNIEASLEQSGLISTMIAKVRGDLSIRFRFTYYIVRTLQVWLLGANFELWHIMQSIAAVLSMFFSYVFARKMRISQWLSCIFVVVIFIGRQSEALWRLGPQENLGMMLLMLTFLSLLHYLKNKRFLIVCIILTFFLGGAKESFLIMLPLLPVWLVIVECRNQESGQINLRTCWEIAKSRWAYFVSVFLIFFVDMAIVFLVVGTNQIGYAGIDASFGIRDYIWAVMQTCIREYCFGFYTNMNLIGILGVILFSVIYVMKKEKMVKKEWLVDMIVAVIMFVYILCGQLVLYAKSGMYDRYLLPATAGFAIFWIVDMGNLFKKSEHGTIFAYVFFAFLAMGSIMKYDVTEAACQYAQDGKNTTALLAKVFEYVDSDPDIVVALPAVELEHSAIVYLGEKYGMKHVYGLYQAPQDEALYGEYIRNPQMIQSADNEGAQIYIGYVGSGMSNIESLMQEYGGDPDKYNSYTFGDYILYAAKNIDATMKE